MCKAKDLTRHTTANIYKRHLVHRFYETENDCEISDCEICKKNICWENDEISHCFACKKDYCIDCKKLYFCDICEESFCTECKETIELDSIIYCRVCQENSWFPLFDAAYNKNDFETVKYLLERKHYPDEVIDACYVNSIMTFDLKIISLLMEYTSNYHLYNETAVQTFGTFAVTTQLQKKVAKFLIDKIEKRFVLENLAEKIYENNINDDLVEYIELKITSL